MLLNMNLNEIKEAVLSGKKVFWATDNYEVIVDNLDQWMIHSKCNDHYIGLTWRDGTTVNGNPNEFYIGN